LGDSGGPRCEQLGYDEELDAHRQALASLRRSEHVNADSIFIFGASMGGTMAPLLAAEGNVRGVMVWGTTTKTWAEHMIALDRRVLELRGMRADSVHAAAGDHLLFHALSLVEGREPASVIAERPRLAAAWARMLGTDSTRRQQYGRAFRFHHEAQRSNWEGAWAALDIPVLVVRGEYDWIMWDDEHRRIADVANARRPGLARYVTHPGMDHHFLVHASLADAFRGRGGTFDGTVVDTFLSWLAEQRRGRR
jgi:pimeloyl-ACP methyl ester carboxylesterase